MEDLALFFTSCSLRRPLSAHCHYMSLPLYLVREGTFRCRLQFSVIVSTASQTSTAAR